MPQNRIDYLITKELRGGLSEVEKKEIQDWKGESELNARWYDRTKNERITEVYFESLEAAKKKKKVAKGKLDHLVRSQRDKSKSEGILLLFNPRIFKTVAAAVILLFAVGTLWYYKSYNHPLPITRVSEIDVAPARDKIILTQANGKQVALERALIPTLAGKGIKFDSTQIAYNTVTQSNNKDRGEVGYNVITTPAGGKFQVILPDGSKVWLNAMSSLRFPTSFQGKERAVELNGEGYFDIAKDKVLPFVVKVHNLEIDVLGTQFNVKAYLNEGITRTTLVYGSLKVKTTADSKLLSPNQQANLHSDGRINVESVQNPSDESAWVNDLFQFKGARIETVMNELARWYDVDIEYQGIKTNNTFLMAINRQNNASDVLKMLEATGGVHFKIAEGQGVRKKIIVLP